MSIKRDVEKEEEELSDDSREICKKKSFTDVKAEKTESSSEMWSGVVNCLSKKLA